MLKIRLKRVGRRHDPSYRLVVVESTQGPKSGHYKENLGLYDPRSNIKRINTERVSHWLSKGAQVSDTAHNLLVDLGVLTSSKINALPKKQPVVAESSEEEQAPESEGTSSEGSSETGSDAEEPSIDETSESSENANESGDETPEEPSEDMESENKNG